MVDYFRRLQKLYADLAICLPHHFAIKPAELLEHERHRLQQQSVRNGDGQAHAQARPTGREIAYVAIHDAAGRLKQRRPDHDPAAESTVLLRFYDLEHSKFRETILKSA